MSASTRLTIQEIHELAKSTLVTRGFSLDQADAIAEGGFCPLALRIGESPLVKKTKKTGIAALAIHDTYNIAALWPEIEKLSQQGLVAFAFTAANSYVAPAGGSKPVYGTNPMAFGFPREGHPPLVFDQASSASARGEIQLHLRAGKPIPEGWAVDEQGNPWRGH